MINLATSLVTFQEMSQTLNVGMALENMHGEYFYLNDCWPKFSGALTGEKGFVRNSADIYPAEIKERMKQAEPEILRRKVPVGHIIEGNSESESTTHFVLKFLINYSSGEPFCFCTLAQRVENSEQVNTLIKKVKEVLKIDDGPAFRLFNHALDYKDES
jgi:hypothetical protein